MAKKTLLVAFTTTRNGERVRFASKSVVDLTKEEIAEFDKLEKATGKLHYRDPVNESADVNEPEVTEIPNFSGEGVAIGNKSVDQLKSYLQYHGVAFEASDKKPDLVAKAESHAATGLTGGPGSGANDGDDDGDKDGGL